MKKKRYTAGGRADPDGEYVQRRLLLHEIDDESLEALAALNQMTVAETLRTIIRVAVAEAVE